MPEPFSSFMARALFDPQRGYYTRNIRTVGAGGDFSTSATLSRRLGQGIAAWMRQQPRSLAVIEIGAGTGELMQVVRRSLGWWQGWRRQWHIVETSPVLREQQQQRLGSSVIWHASMQEALAACGGVALIYHHELLDAFPANLIEWRDGCWQELWVPEELRRMKKPAGSFSALEWSSFKEGQRCELHPSIREWLQSWAPHWKSGVMLSIDYGDEFPALYHRRPAGTLRGYFMHQRIGWPELLQNAGRMDLTADINFTDYRAWCRELGWEEASYEALADFLMRHLPEDMPLDALSDAEGVGGAFKCLVHHAAGSPA
jgi:SAM-dependent MidA family methyltransferase